LRKGKAPDPLQQLEHMSDLAQNPKNALNPNDQYLTEGGRKGGIPKESPHGQKNSTEPGSPGQRLREWQAKNPEVTPKVKKGITPTQKQAGDIKTKGNKGPGGKVNTALILWDLATTPPPENRPENVVLVIFAPLEILGKAIDNFLATPPAAQQTDKDMVDQSELLRKNNEAGGSGSRPY